MIEHHGTNVLLALNWATESRHLIKMKHININIKMGDLAETSPVNRDVSSETPDVTTKHNCHD